MDALATPPPALPGTWTVTASPRWGHARVQDAVGHSLTILSSVQAHADAAAAILGTHAALLAERDRYRNALWEVRRFSTDAAARHDAGVALGMIPESAAEGVPC